MTEDEIHTLFLAALRKAGGTRSLARLWNITPSYVSDLVHKRRPISDSVAARLGFERVVEISYWRKDEK